ncbi:MAG: superoxide dismutase [Thaumarchaeota archaeon]|nr:MAG: superoxide dismutase [Nitrososphaerota archaeon]TLX81434.1 MAG: superoxide dismutase [Nitrososphaerota archaeon]
MVKYELPKLPYAYDALEPHIDAKTMEIHHTKHHQAYTNGLNTALESLSSELQNMELTKLLSSLDKVPENVRGAVNFHGGGYDNHTLFWNNMKPNGGGTPGGKVSDAIKSVFGSFDTFKEKFSKDSGAIQGSGWGWLAYNPATKKVEFTTMPNQTSPRTKGLIPLLGLDVWEHAYYLKYQNRRPDYITAWWNVVNWDEVENRLSKV